MAIIYTYAWHTIGEVALAMVVLALILRQTWLAAAAMGVGAAALVLYCFEPGAIATVSGALLLVRAQTPASDEPDPGSAKHEAKQYP
jgi:hypothetical protein